MITSLYEPFRHWAEKGSVYLLGDTHFASDDCILMDPDWISVDQQIDVINKTIGQSDTFVCLGDVGELSYVSRIKAGLKVLIRGNHDATGACRAVFDEVFTGPIFIAEKILLSHEPVTGLKWALNIHGHDHSGTEEYIDGCKHINLAANVCGYKPVSLGKLIKSGILADIEDIHSYTIKQRLKS